MKRVLVSTSRRHTRPDEPSGHLIAYDLENQKVVIFSEIIEHPYREEDPNPRGGLRGLKGISLHDNQIALANSSTVFFYDNKWNPISYLWHPSCAGIHDIALLDDRIWITGSRNDLLMCFDLDGKLLEFYDARTFASLLNLSKWQPKPFLTTLQINNGEIDFRDPRTHDDIFCDSSHVNGIAITQKGDLLVSCGLLASPNHLRLLSIKNWLGRKGAWQEIVKFNMFMSQKIFMKRGKNRHSGDLILQPAKGYSAVLRITEDRDVQPCLLFANATAPAHSVRALHDGTAIYLQTTSGEIIHFEPESGTVISSTVVGESYLRGACELPDGSLLLGDSNKIIHFNLHERKILSVNLISDDRLEAIYDFCPLPDHFDLPPMSFVDHHAKYLPVSQI
jgi:hypothetical protein